MVATADPLLILKSVDVRADVRKSPNGALDRSPPVGVALRNFLSAAVSPVGNALIRSDPAGSMAPQRGKQILPCLRSDATPALTACY